MYTIMSWYLPATKKATQESFFDSVKAWQTDNEGNSRQGLDLSALPTEPTQSFSTVLSCELANLKIVCSEDDSFEYSGFSFERIHSDGNFARVFECVLKKAKLPNLTSAFEARISKYTLDCNKEYNYIDNEETHLPSFINAIIENGLALKEINCDLLGRLKPEKEDIIALENCNNTLYPIVYINKSVPSFKENLETLNGYSSVFHLIETESSEPWHFRVLFKKFTDTDGNPYRKDFSDISLLIDCIFPLVNTSVSQKDFCDYQFILRAFEKNYSNKKVVVSDGMVKKIKDARNKKGMTQGELANYIASIKGFDNPFNSLFISRIESKRQKRIEIDKLSMLEESLDLPNGYLSAVDDEGDTLAISQVNTKPAKMNFCSRCGNALPTGRAVCFCPYCGENLTD